MWNAAKQKKWNGAPQFITRTAGVAATWPPQYRWTSHQNQITAMWNEAFDVLRSPIVIKKAPDGAVGILGDFDLKWPAICEANPATGSSTT